MDEIQLLKSRLMESATLKNSVSNEVFQMLEIIQERLEKLETFIIDSPNGLISTPNTLSPISLSPTISPTLSPSLSPNRQNCVSSWKNFNHDLGTSSLLLPSSHSRTESKSTTESFQNDSNSFPFPPSPMDETHYRSINESSQYHENDDDDIINSVQRSNLRNPNEHFREDFEQSRISNTTLSSNNFTSMSSVSSSLLYPEDMHFCMRHQHSSFQPPESTRSATAPASCSSHSLPCLFDDFCEIISFSGSNIEKEVLKNQLEELNISITSSSPLTDFPAFFIPETAIDSLREITPKLLEGGFTYRCLRAYRKRRLQELKRNLQILGNEKLNFLNEEYKTLSWDDLFKKMNKWMQLMQIFLNILMPGERLLCEKIFSKEDGGNIDDDNDNDNDELIHACFLSIIKGVIRFMLKEGEDMATCKLMPEKVKSLLEMYACVLNLKSELEKLPHKKKKQPVEEKEVITVEEERQQQQEREGGRAVEGEQEDGTGEEVGGECWSIHSAINSFLQDLSAIVHESLMHFAMLVEMDGITSSDSTSASSPSPSPSPCASASTSLSSSRASSLSRSSRIRLNSVLNVIVKNMAYPNVEKEKNFMRRMGSYAHKGRLPLTSYVINYIHLLCNRKGMYSEILCSMYSQHPPANGLVTPFMQAPSSSSYARTTIFLHILTALIENLETKSKMFKDEGACQVFLLNNIHYVLVNIAGSDLRNIVGSEWCRYLERMIQNRCHRLIRYVFSKFGDIFESEEYQEQKEESISNLKKKLSNFNMAIEELYEKRCLHIIPNNKLKAYVVGELTRKIVSSYSTFIDRHCSVLLNQKKLKKLCIYQPSSLQSTLVNCFSQI